MNAGELRNRIRIESASAGAWSVLDVVSGRIRGLQGSQLDSIAKLAPNSDSEVLLRYRRDVTAGMRLRTGGRTLFVDAPYFPNDKNTEVILFCTEDVGTSTDFTVTTRTRSLTDDSVTPVVSTVTCTALEVEGDNREYETLSLVGRDPVTLSVRTSTPGTLPPLGSVATWGSVVRTVKSVRPAATPTGIAIAARVVMSR